MLKKYRHFIFSTLMVCFLTCNVPCVALADNTDIDTSKANIVFEEGFEIGVNNATQVIMGRKTPLNWTWSDLRSPRGELVSAGIDESESLTGNSSLCIGAVQWNSAGFLSPAIPLNLSSPEYQMTVNVKSDIEYNNNRPKLAVQFFRDDNLVGSYEEVLIAGQGDWVENTFKISRAKYPGRVFNNIRVRLFTVHVGNGAVATGNVFFDDFEVIATDDVGELVIDVRCDDEICWYHIGETVTYKPQSTLPYDITEVTGNVYNSYDELIHSKTISAASFSNSGWKYTPDEVGHYMVEFIAHGRNRDYKFVSRYTAAKAVYHSISKRSFVVAEKTKPMEERNDMLFASHYEGGGGTSEPPYTREGVYRMHDEVGFRGIRLMGFVWETEASEFITQPNPGKGVYNWTDWDWTFDIIDDYGFKTMAAILFTPRWASSHADSGGTVGTAKVAASNIKNWAVAPPTKTEYYTNYVKKVAERYGEHIDIWEIWNEMNPSSRFWELGTVDEYVELIKDSDELLQEIQPDDMVINGGLVGNSPDFWRELLEAGVYEYTDAMAIHGSKEKVELYRAHDEELGLEPKPWMNTEAHYIVTNTYGSDMDITERQDAMRLVKGYFGDIRNGCSVIALWQVTAAYSLEALPDVKASGKRGISSGLWRRHPFPEPRLAAKVANTLFDVMGKDFRYDTQYLFDDGKTACVNFSNDGEPLLCIWNDSNEFKINEQILNCMSENSTVIDWEGREVDREALLREGTVYYITGVDKEKLSLIEEAPGNVISEVRSVRPQIATEVGYGSTGPLFNKKTFALSDNIVWNEADWQWVAKTGNKLENFDARFAVSLAEDGLYLVVEVDDENIFIESEAAGQMYNYDSIQLGVDVTAQGYSDMRMEVQIGMMNGEPVLYKHESANVSGAIPAGWTMSGALMDNTHTQITAENNKILYKIFIQNGEMYPYKYDPANKELRLSIVANDHDGSARRGLYRWSNGIDGGKDVGKYGKIILP